MSKRVDEYFFLIKENHKKFPNNFPISYIEKIKPKLYQFGNISILIKNSHKFGIMQKIVPTFDIE